MYINNRKMLTGIFAIVIAFACFYASYKMILVYREVQKWQATTATILEKKNCTTPNTLHTSRLWLVGNVSIPI